MPKRKYDDAFIQQALERVARGRSPKYVAEELGCNVASVYKWMKQAGPAKLKEFKRAYQKEKEPTAKYGRYSLALKDRLQLEWAEGIAKPTKHYIDKYQVRGETIRRWAREANIRLPRTTEQKVVSRDEFIQQKQKEVQRRPEEVWALCPENDPTHSEVERVMTNGSPLSLKFKRGLWYYRISTYQDLQEVSSEKAIEASRKLRERTHNESDKRYRRRIDRSKNRSA